MYGLTAYSGDSDSESENATRNHGSFDQAGPSQAKKPSDNELSLKSTDKFAESIRKSAKPSIFGSSSAAGPQVIIRKNASKPQIEKPAEHSRPIPSYHEQGPESAGVFIAQQPEPELEAHAGELAPNNELTAIRARLRPPPIPGLVDWGIPAESSQPCDPAIEAKLAQFMSLKTSPSDPKHFNDSLMSNRNFRNPHLYRQLVDFVDVDDYASNFRHHSKGGEPWEHFGIGDFDEIGGWDAEKIAHFQKAKAEKEQAGSSKSSKRTTIDFSAGKHKEKEKAAGPRVLGSGGKQGRYQPYSTSTNDGGSLYLKGRERDG